MHEAQLIKSYLLWVLQVATDAPRYQTTFLLSSDVVLALSEASPTLS